MYLYDEVMKCCADPAQITIRWHRVSCPAPPGGHGSACTSHTVCFSPPAQCTAFQPSLKIVTWKLRVSLPVYVIAIQSVIG